MDIEKENADVPAAEAPEVGRRAFLSQAGKFAAVTPPAIAMLMSTSLEANALALSCIGQKPVKHPVKVPKHASKPKKKRRSHA